MATRKRARSKASQIAFDAISIEGGVLSPEWLARVASVSAGKQTEAEYRIPKGLSLRDEIGRYWRVAQACWRDFAAGRVASADARALSKQFVTSLLRDAFGFASLAELAVDEIGERSYPIGLAALGKRVPVVVAAAPVPPVVTTIDAPDDAFADEGRRRSAFGLAQEHLNAADHALWGVASDGCTLRILRDNASLTRPAWIEADLQRIFTEERYADFAALWLLLHETRFGHPDHQVQDCALEVWRNAGRDEGVKARETLRFGVEDALLSLGQGFLAHPANQELRAKLESGALPPRDYFNQLLRLVYRVIFLLTVEERRLLHPDGVSAATKALYAEGYGLRRLRERAAKRSSHDRHGDLWEGLKIVFRGVASGEARLGLPALAGIFTAQQCAALDAAKLENRALLGAIFRLAWLREDGALARVNWRDMGPEELGSVYESLLELVPQLTKDGRQFAFATGGETKGNARKTSGSYYTPDSLVQVLLDSALEPVIVETIAKNPGHEAEALLKVSIVDPACGSGHFLLSAARRLAAHVARLQANGTPSAGEYRHALRQVVGRCIYGVDLNPMAVELCKVSLWMEAVEPGLPLTFLNSHIRHGNALLGTTPELMARGIPEAAWEAIEGDDKKTASALKKRNKEERAMPSLPGALASDEKAAVVAGTAIVEAQGDADLQGLVAKEARYGALITSSAYLHQKLVADAWCAAFVWPKRAGELALAAPTHATWAALERGEAPLPITTKTLGELAEQYRFFHWHLQFPHVFSKGGFDVVLGNPPWERTKILQDEFFAGRDSEAALAANTAQRRARIAQLSDEKSPLFQEFLAAKREADGSSAFLQGSGRFPLTARGDINTYALFAELDRELLRPAGSRAGFIVQSDIATGETYSKYFSDLLRRKELVSLFDFVNTENIFPGIHKTHPHFCLVTLARPEQHRAVFSFWNTRVSHLQETERHFSLTDDDLKLLNPETGTCPVFQNGRDAELTKTLCRRFPIVGSQVTEDDWNVDIFQKMFDATIHASSITFGAARPSGTSVPVYEGKTIRHYNHRATTYADVSREACDAGEPRPAQVAELEDPAFEPTTRYWVEERDFLSRLGGRDRGRRWFPGYRYKTNTTNRRTMIVAIRPFFPSVNTLTSIFVHGDAQEQACFVGALSSFVVDYVVRQKMGGTTLGEYILRQLPVPTRRDLKARCTWDERATLKEWFVPRVLELTFTSWRLENFARDIGWVAPPFRWNSDRRFLLACEVDAAFLHLYRVAREAADYLLESFHVLRRSDEEVHGTFRTKRVILDIYDAMADAARSGKPYQTRLEPGPADVRVAHPESTRPSWAKKG